MAWMKALMSLSAMTGAIASTSTDDARAAVPYFSFAISLIFKLPQF
jgi:hypothetical protein